MEAMFDWQEYRFWYLKIREGQRPLLVQPLLYREGPTLCGKIIDFIKNLGNQTWCQAYGNKNSLPRLDIQMKIKTSQMIKTMNTAQLRNKCLNSSERNSTLCRIKVPQKPPFLHAGSSDWIGVGNEIWFCQLFVLKEYLSLLCWWQ